MVTKKTTAPPKKRTAKVEATGEKERAEAVKTILLNVEKQMSAKSVRATLGDYIKLIQLSKEMGDEPKAEIKVGWIEK